MVRRCVAATGCKPVACYGPLDAHQAYPGAPLSFGAPVAGGRDLQVACGQCLGCRLERSREWAIRCLHENQMHDESCFITLTYDDTSLPVDRSLHYPDFQLFMKRLRAHYSERQRITGGSTDKELRHSGTSGPDANERCPAKRIRFFMCGEYGELTARPHYHACLFGVRFNDLEIIKRLSSGHNLYKSGILSSLWPHGHSSVGEVSFDSAAYVARYIVKKITGARAAEHYKYISPEGEVFVRKPEFTHMSLKPGIGAEWYKKFGCEVYPRDEVVIGGKKMVPPKYYDNLLEKDDWDTYEWLQFERYKKGLRLVDDATPERLRARETVARAALAFKRRTLE